MPIKELPNTAHKSGPLLSGAEEAARFSVAVDRLIERAQSDPEYATEFLTKIGYYEMMKDTKKVEKAAAQTATQSTNGTTPKKRKK